MDAHVHVHRCYALDRFFESAWANLSRHAGQPSAGSTGTVKMLLLTESAHEHYFDRATAKAPDNGDWAPLAAADGWRVRRTPDARCLELGSDDKNLFLVAGCQVATSDGLEVLWLGTRERVDDGQPIRSVLEATRGEDALRVIPWGAGKWWFARGRLLDDLLAEFGSEGVCVGDESGRPWFWPTPRHVTQSIEAGILNLPGTDPLPFPGEVTTVGRMGLRIDAPWSASDPVGSLLTAIRSSPTQPETFAELESVSKFFVNQFRMQIRKHTG